MTGKRVWECYRKRTIRFGVILSCVVLLSSGLISPAHAQNTNTQPGDHVIDITVGTVNREFILHVPTKYDGSTVEPLVLMLHGHGGTAKGISKVGWSQEADANSFVVAYPQGSLQDPTKPQGKGNLPAWNDGSKRPGLPPVDDIAFLKAVISYIETNLKIDTQRVYLAGFSNGAAMTFHAAVDMSDQLAAIGEVSGAFWERDDTTIKLAHQMPLIYMIGTADKLNPINGGHAPDPIDGTFEDKPPVQVYLDAWLKLNQCSASPAVIPEQNGVGGLAYACDPNFELDYYIIQGMVHIWPVGPKASADAVTAADGESAEGTGDVPPGYESGATPAASSASSNVRPIFKISGAKTMWQFFTKYTLTGAAQQH